MAERRATAEPAQTVVKVGSDYYVLASSLASRRASQVLADGRSFAVFETAGDIIDSPLEAQGFFDSDTRHLSRFEMLIAGAAPYFLNSYLSDDRAQFRATLTNADLGKKGRQDWLPRNSIRVNRGWVLSGAALYHRLTLHNYIDTPVDIEIDFFYGVDFADVFEVRGLRRKRRGEMLNPSVDASRVELRYRGLDNSVRATEIRFDITPRQIDDQHAVFVLRLEPGENRELECRIAASGESPSYSAVAVNRAPTFLQALEQRQSELSEFRSDWAVISASNNEFATMIRRAGVDLTSIIARGDSRGAFIMAGVPWFATLFGRDSIITALSILPFYPQIAVRTLRTLAKLQGDTVDEARDEQPGKIVHEIRTGEMAATGEVPFRRYYGSVDATPLFLWLYGRCVESTGDLQFADELWPNVERAIEWIERWGDREGDGYVKYLRETPRGLANQGWKDSEDAIFHKDGELARPPIALAEVQGYVYAACMDVASVAARLGRGSVADRLLTRATALKQSFERDFWLEPEGMIALALDADRRPCRVMTSNGAHCLATGLVDGERATAMCKRLLADDMYSGWGIRTLSGREKRYNPMSYHNGSVWPHDNAMAALGLARACDHTGVLKVLEGLFDASEQLNTSSLPELFCGFRREIGLGPVPYPVACYPQAWSAASVFMILQAMLGIRVLGFERRVFFDTHLIPSWLDWLSIDKLRVGDGRVSFVLRRSPNGAAIEVKDKSSGVRVEI
ncbi:glycogen debranching N-terminal domain-containing protein [Candidatus Binatus sp.]|uniref:amylo-alpha-1,6-glucosidase n=1 Tax=Candidatus Binatus sp. TaxID=2811406 RepID=UPI003C9F44F5